ncbi:isoprenyl transferase [Stratiformator vulcanicus]|uniref:Isoprenyl transferase n=1 Tax=Stratiformator vulcanicus TaxID=2527980 RepID=A0A517R034_9PLAN|nr:isoprenyl transferase [Stratiformator vulcanicus]QDT37193.1 Decaprenyl diphosphate synthase-like protein [Stratiformator vulcanicus]
MPAASHVTENLSEMPVPAGGDSTVAMPDRASLPRHVAVIMDGNGRWAKSRGLPRTEGHRKGAEVARKVIDQCAKAGLDQLTLFCLSSENWKRPAEELSLLMDLLHQYVISERPQIIERNLRFSVIGRREGLPEHVLDEIDRSIEAGRGNTGMRLCLALNYGSRAEITDAVRHIAADVASGELKPDQITDATIAERLDTANMPDPDLVIRTAGEMRISNFLLWQISYAELWVTSKCWPDFGTDDLAMAFRDYADRDRRFGGLSD